MKKLILSIALLFAINAYSLQLSIVATSFDTSQTIQTGSQQWADIKVVSGSYTGSDKLQIYIQYKLDGSNYYQGPLVKVFDTVFYPFYLNLPQNTDASRKVNFTMPATALYRNFIIYVNLAPSTFYGIFNMGSIISGIKTNINRNQTVKERLYYSISGQQLENPSGICIEQTIYEDGTFDSKKIFVK